MMVVKRTRPMTRQPDNVLVSRIVALVRIVAVVLAIIVRNIKASSTDKTRRYGALIRAYFYVYLSNSLSLSKEVQLK